MGNDDDTTFTLTVDEFARPWWESALEDPEASPRERRAAVIAAGSAPRLLRRDDPDVHWIDLDRQITLHPGDSITWTVTMG